jgi:hypothetical protein
MKVQSLHCFCAERCQILAGKVSVLYDFLGREDINWRGLSSELARRVFQDNEIGPQSQRRHLKGHQVLQLALKEARFLDEV